YALPVRKLKGQGLVDTARPFQVPWGDNPEINIVDYAKLLRIDPIFSPYIRHLLDSFKKRDLVNGHEVDRLWQENRGGSGNHFFMLVRLASLEVILRCFFDESL